MTTDPTNWTPDPAEVGWLLDLADAIGTAMDAGVTDADRERIEAGGFAEILDRLPALRATNPDHA